MDPQKQLEKILLEEDPMKVSDYDDYSGESKLILKELPYVKTVEKLSMVLYTIFSKQYTPKQALLDWKPVSKAILEDKILGKLAGRLNK
jgi:hypothetical protein